MPSCLQLKNNRNNGDWAVIFYYLIIFLLLLCSQWLKQEAKQALPNIPLATLPPCLISEVSNKKCFLRKVRNRFWRAPPCREAETQPVQSLWFILAALTKIVKIDIRCWIFQIGKQCALRVARCARVILDKR